MSKVLLINPPNFEFFEGVRAYIGIAYLAGILKQNGHDAVCLDYIGNANLPPIEHVVKEYKPDVIGISAFTDVWNSIDEIIREKLVRYKIPIVIGGPHAAVAVNDLMKYPYIDAIASGEAEETICDIVDEIEIRDVPKVYHKMPKDIENFPFPDLDSFYGSHDFTQYNIMTSRGCPYDCSFCCAKITSGKKWRKRSIESCIEEIRSAVTKYPTIESVWIMDDMFNLKKERGKELIEAFLKENFKPKLVIGNMRADSIDRDLLKLCRKLGMETLSIAVESGNQEVFDGIKKKEKLEHINDIINLCHEEDMLVNMLMIVGLPGDNLERTWDSINFIKKHRSNANAWNMMFPYPGTVVKDYFDQHGTIYAKDMLMYREDKLIVEPIIDTPDFTLLEREKAYLMARLETASYDLRHPMVIVRELNDIMRHGLLMSLFRGLNYGFWIRVRRLVRRYTPRVYKLFYRSRFKPVKFESIYE